MNSITFINVLPMPVCAFLNVNASTQILQFHNTSATDATYTKHTQPNQEVDVGVCVTIFSEQKHRWVYKRP